VALLPVAVVVGLARRQPGWSWVRRAGVAIVDPRVAAAALAAALGSAVFHNALFNWQGFMAHFTLLSTLGDLAIVPRTAAGYAELTARTLAVFRFSLGWPSFVLAVAGLVSAALRPDRRWWLWLLLVPLSCHLTFTWVTLYVCDRYVFGGVFVLALFAGAAVDDLLARSSRRVLGRAMVAAALAYALLRSASINVLMDLDARESARQWISATQAGGATAGMVGAYLPRLDRLRGTVPVARVADLAAAKPDIVVVNSRYAQRFRLQRSPDGRLLMAGLWDGSLGYAHAARFRGEAPFWAVLQYEDPFTAQGEAWWTNLDKINPEVLVFERTGSR
jgi:hypothetical protein